PRSTTTTSASRGAWPPFCASPQGSTIRIASALKIFVHPSSAAASLYKSTPAATPPKTCATPNAAPTSLKRNSTSKSISAAPNPPDLGPNPGNAILLNGALGLVFVGVEQCSPLASKGSTPSRRNVS